MTRTHKTFSQYKSLKTDSKDTNFNRLDIKHMYLPENGITCPHCHHYEDSDEKQYFNDFEQDGMSGSIVREPEGDFTYSETYLCSKCDQWFYVKLNIKPEIFATRIVKD